jgi:succinate dehydrogenase subunit D
VIRPHRNHAGYWAFLLHRFSGLGLALFLPAHFLVLGLAIEDADQLENFLAWTDSLSVKIAEMGLVFLLSVHLLGGLRLLAIEFLPWRDWQKPLILLAGGVSATIAVLFIVNAV